MIDFYGTRLNAFKANLHTHSTASDGVLTRPELIDLYRRHDYDVLAITDHRQVFAADSEDGKGMTLLNGAELHPANGNRIWHLLCLGLPTDFPVIVDEATQPLLDRLNAAGALCFVAHPYWTGNTSAQIMNLQGILGIEVFNTTCRTVGKALSAQTWDELLDAGGDYTALAVDDFHRPQDTCTGFTVICAENNTPECLLAALKKGQFYASTGPRFTRLTLDNDVFSADFSTATTVTLVSNCGAGRCGCQPRGSNDISELNSVSFDLTALRGRGLYFRLQITDADGNSAWTNSFRIPESQ